MDRLKYKFYIIWALFNAIFGIVSYLFMVETAGKSLEDIDGIFARNRGWIARSREERTKFCLREAPLVEMLHKEMGMDGEKSEKEHVEQYRINTP